MCIIIDATLLMRRTNNTAVLPMTWRIIDVMAGNRNVLHGNQ